MAANTGIPILLMKPLHLIIDGSDNLGKTTVLSLLSQRIGLPIIKMPNMKDYIEMDKAEVFSKLFNETVVQFVQYPFLLDRGYTSSQVYSKLFGRKFDLGYLKDTEEALQPKIIIFTGRHRNGMTGEVTYKSFCKDKIFNEEEKSKIDEEFCNMAEERGYPLIEVNGRTPLSIVEMIQKMI